MPNQTLAVDGVFRALSDPTRRAVISRLASGPATMTDLARPFEMALPSFLQHLKVLEGCGVLASEKVGRVRTYRLQPHRLKIATDWLNEQREIWERRLDRLDEHLLVMKAQIDA